MDEPPPQRHDPSHTSVNPEPGRAEIDADVQLKPGLDTIVGLVPARSQCGSGGRGRRLCADFDNSTLVPEYPRRRRHRRRDVMGLGTSPVPARPSSATASGARLRR
jgi:hypothetical protein